MWVCTTVLCVARVRSTSKSVWRLQEFCESVTAFPIGDTVRITAYKKAEGW